MYLAIFSIFFRMNYNQFPDNQKKKKMSFTKRKLFQKIKQLYPKIEVQGNDFKDAAQEAFFTLLRTDNQNAACQPKIEEFLTNFIKVVRRFWNERNVHSHMERMFKNHAVYFDKPIDIAKRTQELLKQTRFYREYERLIKELQLVTLS